MADKHTLNYEVRELKLGASFTNNKASQYHTIKYDFKPASVDVNKMATVDVGTNNQVTVTVPHLDGAGVPQTVFKGSQRPYTKECVLIIDRVTGEITLEKLSSNIQVKKTRQESATKARPLTPVTTDLLQNTTQRSSSRTRVATNRRTANPSGVPCPGGAPATATARLAIAGAAGAASGGAGPPAPKVQNMVRSPARVKTSPPQAAPWSGGGNSTLASLPMIGLDDLGGGLGVPAPVPALPPPRERRPERVERPEPERPKERPYVPDRQFNPQPPPPAPAPAPHPPSQPEDSSSSSSSDSDSGSGSDSDSDDDRPQHVAPAHSLHHTALSNGNVNNSTLPSDVLNDDLCLSESGSDSD